MIDLCKFQDIRGIFTSTVERTDKQVDQQSEPLKITKKPSIMYKYL